MGSIQDFEATLRFQGALIETLAVAVRELGVDLDGQFSDRALTAIHERIRHLAPLAEALPDRASGSLVAFDLLVGLFPPPAAPPGRKAPYP